MMTDRPLKQISVMDPTAEILSAVYAEALLETVGDNELAEQLIEELDKVIELMDAQGAFYGLISGVIVSNHKRGELIERVFSGRVSKQLEAFLSVAARRNRLNLLRGVRRHMRGQLNRRENKIAVSVTTAVRLDAAQVRRLEDALAQVIGGQPVLELTVNPSIIGGMVVRIGDTLYNASLLSRLKQIRRRLGGRIEILSRRGLGFTQAGT